MNDFNLINFKGRKLTIETYNILYEKSWEYLAGQIFNESNRKKIVITHHLPSPLCNIEKYWQYHDDDESIRICFL